MNLNRIAALLSQGLKASQVATIVGLSPARLSQLLKESQELQNLIAEKQAETEKEDAEETAVSAKYKAAEHFLLDQVIALAPMSDLKEVTQALRVVAERDIAKRRLLLPTAPVSPANINNTLIVNLPTHALPRPEIVVNSENEVIAINENTLAPLSSEGVTALFSSLRKGKENEQARIPAGAEAFTAEAFPAQAFA